MGFSLEAFFGDLEHIMSKDGIDEQDRLRELEDCIRDGKRYAVECGHIPATPE